MASPTERLASAVLWVFRQQRRQAEGGKERFAFAQLQEAMLPAIADLYLAGAKRGRAGPEVADALVAAARERASLAARMIADTTAEWLASGRDPETVFSADRAAMVALSEATNAVQQGRALAVQARGGKLRWVLSSKPCKVCRRFGGRVVKAGKAFGVVDGRPIYNPGPDVHPNCHCKLVEV